MSAAWTRKSGPGGRDRDSVSAQHQRLFQELLEQHCGVVQGLGSLSFLERKLMPRVEALGLGSLEDYYRFLKYDDGGGDELEILVDRLTTNETYFFREQPQLTQFYEVVVPRWVDSRPTSTFRVWSAGCSTGEEVYSLAMLLHEHPAMAGRDFEVVGTDISRGVISKAREGCYLGASFRSAPSNVRERYFVETGDGRWSVKPKIRSHCSFGQLNLIDRERFGILGKFDVVFCRNVLIYFSTRRRPAVIDGFYDVLNDDGHLFLGHSESLLNIRTRFACIHLERGVVYRREREGPR